MIRKYHNSIFTYKIKQVGSKSERVITHFWRLGSTTDGMLEKRLINVSFMTTVLQQGTNGHMHEIQGIWRRNCNIIDSSMFWYFIRPVLNFLTDEATHKYSFQLHIPHGLRMYAYKHNYNQFLFHQRHQYL
jgi:hypothetical protein